MTLPPDQPARDAIATDLDTTMIVEAAAGTGKTTSLVERMLNLVRSGRARASSIAAITFTFKAGAQLRERFQEGVEKALTSSADAGARTRLKKALDELDRGFIGTTHAFCARLLRERPVEAGLDPEFRELDETSSKLLTAAFWNSWYEQQARAANPLVVEAREIGLDRKILRDAFFKVIDFPDVTLLATHTPRPDVRRVFDKLTTIIEEVEDHLPDDTHREEPDEFEQLIVNLLRKRRSCDPDDPLDQVALLEEGNHKTRKAVQKRWPDGKVAKQLTLRYREFVIDEVKPAIQQWREHAHGIAIDLLRSAAADFAAERRRNGTLTFQDLLVCARDLLRDHPNVRRYFQRRFTHILVDEFQDTDPLQSEMLFFLTGEDVEEKNWRKLRPRPGSLFIVGDPKQSIYRFRRADITTYLEVKRKIEESGGRCVELFTNFRSAPSICTFVNEAFTTMFTADDVAAGRQAKHVDLAPHHNPQPPAGIYALEWPDTSPNPGAEAEAEWIAQWIRRSVDGRMLIDDTSEVRPLRWRDVLIVSWHKPRLGIYAQAFERAGIPYEITGSKAFNEQSDLAMCIPLLRAVVDADDAVSVAAFLRGRLCGADDDALHRFVLGGGRFTPFREPPAGTDERIVRGLTTIREGIEDSRRHPPAATIARLLERVGLVPLSLTEERPGTRSGNILLALSLARKLSAEGESFAAIVDHLADLLGAESDIEELDVDPSRDDAVLLMNLHQVKGLEAPVVFLADPSDDREHPIDLFVDRTSEESIGHFAVARKWGPHSTKELAIPAGWEDFQTREREFRHAERLRLLYVAATRARNMLVVGYRQTKSGIKGAWRDLAGSVKDRLKMPDAVESIAVAPAAAVMQFDEARAQIAARFRAAQRTSYSVLPITKIAHDSHAQLVRAEEGLGRGTSWGRVLHRLFEAMLRDDSIDVQLYAANLLKDEERDAIELEEVLRVVTAVRASPLWQRMRKADEVHAEVPFAIEVPARSIGIDFDGNTLLHGAIDAVFREGQVWHIVDYKSDHTAGRIDDLVRYYAPQVEHYVRFWRKITGAETKGGLFFVDGLIEKWI